MDPFIPPKFHDTFHVSKNLIKTSYYHIRSKSLITPHSTQQTPPRCFLNVIGGYHTCEIINTCKITNPFEITEFTKVMRVLVSCNQCVMHTKVAFSKLGRHVCQANVIPVQDMTSLLILLLGIEN